jgi:hypothetical protein
MSYIISGDHYRKSHSLVPPYAALQRADLTRRGVCNYGQLLKLQMNLAVV